MTPEQSILKNLIMLAVAFIVYKTAQKQSISKMFLFGFSGLTIISMWLFLPMPNQEEFPFESFTHFENKGRVDLSSGEKLIAVFNLDCEHCQEAAAELGELERAHEGFPDLYVLFYKEGTTTVDEFESLTQSKFPSALLTSTLFLI